MASRHRSPKRYTTSTLDQFAKNIAAGRIGTWAAGYQRFPDSDVYMLVGTNPPLSMQGITGFPIHDGLRRVDEARANGTKVIVVDPRRTEAAAHADLHVPIAPGSDASFFAGVINVVLSEGLYDREFCERWVNGVDELRESVMWATPEVIGRHCDIDADLVVQTARMFGSARRGPARSGTGPDMGPHANAAEHLIVALNVICGRYAREGDVPTATGVLGGPANAVAMAMPPTRFWEKSYRMRNGAMGLGGELPAQAMIDDILAPGEQGKLRALVVCGANPAAAYPDQRRIVEALQGLELLVTLDPLWSETAKLAHYVVAPALGLERWDDTRGYEGYMFEPFAQVSGPVLDPPPGVIEDWHFYWDLAHAMGLTLQIGKRSYPPGTPRPPTLDMIEDFAQKGFVPHAEVREHPHGKVFAVEPDRVRAAPDDANGRFELWVDDAAGDCRAAWQAIGARAEAPDTEFPTQLIVRRNRDAMNTMGRRLPGAKPYNPLFVHPDDLAALGVKAGSLVRMRSRFGATEAVVQPDATMRPGSASMTHCYGGLPGDDDDPWRYGTNPNRLLSIDENLQTISLMPQMTAVPIRIEAIEAPSERP